MPSGHLSAVDLSGNAWLEPEPSPSLLPQPRRLCAPTRIHPTCCSWPSTRRGTMLSIHPEIPFLSAQYSTLSNSFTHVSLPIIHAKEYEFAFITLCFISGLKYFSLSVQSTFLKRFQDPKGPSVCSY